MPSLPGTDHSKEDPGQCMVVGCTKRGIYRKNTKSERGYCRDHRSYATSAYEQSVRVSHGNLILQHLDDSENENEPGYGHGV